MAHRQGMLGRHFVSFSTPQLLKNPQYAITGFKDLHQSVVMG